MTESIVSLLNTKLLATGYFKTLYGLADFKTSEGRTIPYMYCSKGNYKEVSNFDELNGSVYWRKTGEIRVTDGTSTAVKLNSRLLVMTIPLKMVATISRNRAGNDTGSTPENVAMSLFKSIASNLNGNIRQILQAKSIRLELNTINDDTRVIASEEFKGTGLTSLGDDLFMVSITLDAVMSIYEDCIPVDCDPTEACENLLLWLSAAQKNECILPAYDFTDPNVYNNLTDTQETALIELLCEGTGGTVTITNTNGTYNVIANAGDTVIVPVSVVSNSDDTYTTNVPATQPLEIPDISVTQPNGGTSAYPSVKNFSCTQIGALLTSDLISQLTEAQVVAIYNGRATINVIEYTSGTTYNKPSDLLYALVACIGGGGGGGSGRRGAVGTNRSGGGGGSSGSISRRTISNVDMPSSVVVTIGAGGAGGAIVGTNDTSGSAGIAGGNTTFGLLVTAPGGNGGAGGGAAATASGGAAKTLADAIPGVFPLTLLSAAGSVGQSINGTAGGSAGMISTLQNNAGGGGGINTSNAQSNGGLGSRVNNKDGVLSAVVAFGSAGGGNGGNGVNNVALQYLDQFPFSPSVWNTLGLGSSGGGGGSNITGDAGAGGNGGIYGGAGGGGGASLNGFNSGKGGDGGQGCVIIVEVRA